MSDDRFKEARRSLIDDDDEGDDDDDDQSGGEQGDDGEIAEAETQLVDLDSLAGGQGEGADQQQQSDTGDDSGGRRGGSPNRSRGDNRSRPPNDGPADSDSTDTLERDISDNQSNTGQRGRGSSDATNERQQAPASRQNQSNRASGRHQTRDRNPNAPDDQHHHSESEVDTAPDVSITSRPDQPDQSRQQSAPQSQQQQSRPPSRQPGQSQGQRPSQQSQSSRQSRQTGEQQPPPSQSGGAGGRRDSQQVFVPGDQDASSEEKTAFVNLNDFADAEPNSEKFTPDEHEAGYEGSTQFVDLESLTEGAADEQDESVAIEDDDILQMAYEFGPGDIDRGEITLIYAYNDAGAPVILRQVWNGDADAMPTDLRERINQLDELTVPNLITLNGMLIGESGAWVELNSPSGRRMSEILTSEGPQSPKRVVGWIRAIGRALATLHDHGLVYANLTPETVWIDDEDNAFLEPFDVCSLKDRDDLGQFGPPEMNVAENAHQLSPATDVYSLAAVTLAGITGIPLDPKRVAAIESEDITRAVRDAVVDAPRERTQSIQRFVNQLGTGGESLFDGLHPADLDFKVLLGITLVLMAATTGLLFLLQGSPGSRSGADRAGNNGAATAGSTSDDESGGEADPTAGDGPTETAQTEPPGPIDSDPRLTVQSSYQTNPPLEADRTDGNRSENIEDLRKQARTQKEEADKVEAIERKQKLQSALEAITEAVRLQGDDVADQDLTFQRELEQTELMRQYRRKLVERVFENLEKGSIADARIAYQNLRAVDTSAIAGEFFGTINSAQVERATPTGTAKDDEEGDDAE